MRSTADYAADAEAWLAEAAEAFGGTNAGESAHFLAQAQVAAILTVAAAIIEVAVEAAIEATAES